MTLAAYVGQTRSRALILELEAAGIGECTQRGEWPPRRRPSFLDNSAFSDWRKGRDFDNEAFLSDCASASADPEPPDFGVCPDRVATGLESLAFSLRWLDSYESAFPGLRWYLAVQDGMAASDVVPHCNRFVGLFVGGTLQWKLQTGAAWVSLAHELGLRCHIGRCGTVRRVRWAQRIGADSIDSCLPLWSRSKLADFIAALSPSRQRELWA